MFCAKFISLATCVFVVNYVCKENDAIYNNIIWFQLVIYIFLFSGSYY